MKRLKNNELDIIIPVTSEIDWPSEESIIETILKEHNDYGFKRFALACPAGGHRRSHYPERETFKNLAELFLKVKNRLSSYDIDLGWWNTLTIKSGPSEKFTGQINYEGKVHPTANCPSDPNFKKQLSEDIAYFASIAKPSFIILEDDYSIVPPGCFCKYHLNEFEKEYGKKLTKEELFSLLQQKTDESIKVIKTWHKVCRNSLVNISEAIRNEVDKLTPEIPIGFMQSGGANINGNCTKPVARALAGKNHTPFVRFQGTFYGNVVVWQIPTKLHNSLYFKQHIDEEFMFYHESDTFPHTRYFMSSGQMKMIMSIAFSYGFDGSIFIDEQLLDDPTEETAYGKMYKKERERFNEINCIAKKCEVKGVTPGFDPFWNAVSDIKRNVTYPLWSTPLSRFGIPYTSVDTDVMFLDKIQTQNYDEETLIKYLSKNVFLDGEAAKSLCERGLGKYIGIDVGEDVTTIYDRLSYDLGAREVICDKFTHLSKGKNMPSAFMLAPKNGNLMEIKVTDKKCEVITEFFNFDKEYICPAMTRFENELGGKVVVMGLTIDRTNSQSLYNYRRQSLFNEMIKWMSDEYILVNKAPDVFTIVNEAKNPKEDGFYGMLTFINMCPDTLGTLDIHLPPKYKKLKEFLILDKNAVWKKANIERTDDGIIIKEEFNYTDPVYILIK
ncbi:MAG: hypothetical protein E7391_01550 [Ruminococcaceae bacterium]|nr:hypothetical protein [Oscillospiraceae bacterium]